MQRHPGSGGVWNPFWGPLEHQISFRTASFSVDGNKVEIGAQPHAFCLSQHKIKNDSTWTYAGTGRNGIPPLKYSSGVHGVLSVTQGWKEKKVT